MRHLGLIIFLIIVMIITAIYPTRFAVVEYFDNKKDASGNPIPKSTKTTTKTKSSGSSDPPKTAPKTPSKEPSKTASKDPKKEPSKTHSKDPKKDSKDTKESSDPSSDSSGSDPKNIGYDETISQPNLNPYETNYGGAPTLNSDKQSLKVKDTHSKKTYSGIKGMKDEMSDAWIPKASLIPCSCPTMTCAHNLKQNSDENDFGLLNEGTEEGTDIGPFSRPLIADVQLPNSALNKEWVRTNLMTYQAPKPFLSDFQAFTY